MANSVKNSVVSFECNVIAFAVSTSELGTGVKVIAQHPDNPKERVSVSVPLAYRKAMELNKPQKMLCHWSADKRFLVGDGLGNAKASKGQSKAEADAFAILEQASKE